MGLAFSLDSQKKKIKNPLMQFLNIITWCSGCWITILRISFWDFDFLVLLLRIRLKNNPESQVTCCLTPYYAQSRIFSWPKQTNKIKACPNSMEKMEHLVNRSVFQDMKNPAIPSFLFIRVEGGHSTFPRQLYNTEIKSASLLHNTWIWQFN